MKQELTLVVRNAVVLNSNQRLHLMEKANCTKEMRELAFYSAKRARLAPMGKVHCHVFIAFATDIRRDPANYYPSVKAMIDGLVSAGIFKDDDHKHFIGPDMRINPKKSSRGAVEFTFVFEEVA